MYKKEDVLLKTESNNLNSSSLYKLYSLALNNQDIHKSTNMDLMNINVNEIFNGKNALEFIKNYLGLEKSKKHLNNSANKLLSCLNKITPFRAKHTVSAFLLGISVKENLSLDIRNWIRLYDSHSSDQSFGFFWSLICLLHDVGYYWERNSKQYKDKYQSIDAFGIDNEIKYNLLENSNQSGLIQRYYDYRINVDSKIDHGIVGAILIYDALLTLYYEDANETNLFCGIKLRSNFPDFVLKIAETIALHNMWRANSKNEKLYIEYGLFDLVPNELNSHKIFYNDDKVLFLLGLIDTIDPIKAFCNSERNMNAILPQMVMNQFCLKYYNKNVVKSMDLIYYEVTNNTEKYKRSVSGLADWMGVDISDSFEGLKLSFLNRDKNESFLSA